MIPAHPLALTEARRLDERRQAALTRYYCDAGAGGIAVGVHTTQFAIRDPAIQLLRPVLELAIRTAREWSEERRIVTIAGVCGPTGQAVAEAELAASFDYDAALVSLAALGDADNERLLDHCRHVSDVIPIIGFYLQPAVGGRILDRAFWRVPARRKDQPIRLGRRWPALQSATKVEKALSSWQRPAKRAGITLSHSGTVAFRPRFPGLGFHRCPF